MDMFANYAGRASEMKAYLADAQINRDRDLRLQYLAGLGLNLYQSGPIYAEILRHKKYPEGLFSGSPETMRTARERASPRASRRRPQLERSRVARRMRR